MLAGAKLVAFAATTDGARAADFYTKVLGLTVRYQDEFAVSLESDGVELRLQKIDSFTPQTFTTLGWQVENVKEVVRQLARRGVKPELYSWMEQDAAEVRSAIDGLVAYCGTYETNEQLHYVIHHVAADKNPSIVGTNRTRIATVTGDRLILRPVDLPAGVKEWTVEWERVGAAESSLGRP
jgi:hypothetical protein